MVNAIQEKVLEKLNVPQDRFKEIFLNAKTLRLTRKGRNRLVQKYDSWKFEDHGLKSGDTLDLQRKMIFPYFIDSNNNIKEYYLDKYFIF